MKTSSPKKAQDFNDKAINVIALSELYLPFGNALCHYNAVALPGDCHATLAMTQYFVRNGTIFCLLKSNSTFNIRSLCYCVQRTFCHCEERSDVAISRKGILFIKPKTINSIIIRFHQLPHLFNTTIYQYVIIQSVVIYESKSVLLTA